MPAAHKEFEAQAIELSTEAFEAFCDDISGMFNVDMECKKLEACNETIQGLKKRFKKLIALDSVKASGALNGTFHLIFDQAGLFILSGVIVMLPEKRILEEAKRGTINDVESMNDAIKEVGNLLVGSWDRVFREGLKEHKHFLQTDTYIGTPWDNPQNIFGVNHDEELIYVHHEMTIGSYPTFNCGVIFSHKIFEPEAESEAKENNSEEKEAGPEKKENEEEALNIENEKEEVKSKEDEKDEKETINNEGDSEKITDIQESEAEEAEPIAEEVKTVKKARKKSKAKVKTKSSTEHKPTVSSEHEVSDAIKRMTQSTTNQPVQSEQISLFVSAKDIMEKNPAWCSPDADVRQALMEMQQLDTGYLLIGEKETLEGIVSRSDITGAISPYIRSIFVKWRRPQDDATLQIKLKWIMSRPVHTIKPDTSLTDIMDTMCRFGCRCLPVINNKGKVEGTVNVFDIFRVLNESLNIETVGKTLQAPFVI